MNPERWRQIEELYQSVLKLGAAERTALLAGVEPELRHEVESLLAQVGDSTVTQIVAGFQLGTYRVEAPIGQGGMGVVYRAHDTKLNRPVAIKFFSDELADAAARRRFQREAQMASSLNHPHILTVYDVGEYEGRQHLVTEFVDGGTLKDWARRQQRSWQDVAELLTGVADGLATAHQAGILHRDIKPDNILIAASGYAKLADFGLAKLEEGARPVEVTRTLTAGRTRPGMIVGTIAYMSPEQASAMPLDARSDIFSFAVALRDACRAAAVCGSDGSRIAAERNSRLACAAGRRNSRSAAGVGRQGAGKRSGGSLCDHARPGRGSSPGFAAEFPGITTSP